MNLHQRLRLFAMRLARPRRVVDVHDLKAVNVAMVDDLLRVLPHDEAMATAIGGDWDAGGARQAAILRHYGLCEDSYLVDVGCGAGRLAGPLSTFLRGRYLGVDLVPALVANARRVAARPDWRFEVIDHIGIPETDGVADMVCFFSVLTHVTHEQAYWYLEEAKRVLKPGGRIVFSFLEYREPGHMKIFHETVASAKSRVYTPPNVFLDRSGLQAWAEDLGLSVVEFRDGGDPIVTEGNLGQALCVLEKR